MAGPTTVAATPTTIVRGGNCPNGWRASTQFCYYFSNTPVKWTQGDNACKLKQSDSFLASVPNIKELDWLDEIVIDKKRAFWIGGRDQGSILPGMTDYVWSDGEPWNDDVAKEAGFDGRPNQCVIFNPRRIVMWNSAKCNNQRRYICKLDKNEITTMAPTIRTSSRPTTAISSVTTPTVPKTTETTSSKSPTSSPVSNCTSKLPLPSSINPTTSTSPRPTTPRVVRKSTSQFVRTTSDDIETTKLLVTDSPSATEKTSAEESTSTVYVIVGVVGVCLLTLLISVIALYKRRRNKSPKGAQPLEDESLYGAGSKRNSVYDSTDGMGTRENPMYFALDGKDEALIRAKELAAKETATAKETTPC
ncbi:unnamed protein product [Owenia fusiformis]|uniref:Uncharacterized protein n=1 Tax=Owenia fusiformis TaxID=6347 RepID=A0A8J1TY80_OWEFU|nr:unnamed protein product [Owenia fusiformis]